MKPVDDDHEFLVRRDVEADTRILKADYRRVCDVPMLIERWSGDGVMGSSAVLLTRDVGERSDDELKVFLTEKVGLDLTGSVTICRREQHVFVNFGFVLK